MSSGLKELKTLPLLEVSETARQKYGDQSQKTSHSWLLSALNITSQSDLNYKNSHNARLLVELTLMKIASLASVLTFSEHESPELKKKAV